MVGTAVATIVYNTRNISTGTMDNFGRTLHPQGRTCSRAAMNVEICRGNQLALSINSLCVAVIFTHAERQDEQEGLGPGQRLGLLLHLL